jgi:hypothetical protein
VSLYAASIAVVAPQLPRRKRFARAPGRLAAVLQVPCDPPAASPGSPEAADEQREPVEQLVEFDEHDVSDQGDG